ncbi:general odorant-binding protein 1-like [Cydia amplana]|uniref:general odorant-binding protein 1-like n=1 Tax=Cydia amplana TaxID=1869771 RepID=UPI002FE6A89E
MLEFKMAAATKWWTLVAAFILSLCVNRATPSAEIMKKLTTGFATALDKCKTELNVQENIMQDFYNFWREDFELLNRDTGCVILCMALKFDLIDEDAKLHHKNAHEFAKTHGADDDLAKQLVTMIHECEKANTEADDCIRALEIAKCFRTKIHGLKWAPSMETVLEEVMTEVKPS